MVICKFFQSRLLMLLVVYLFVIITPCCCKAIHNGDHYNHRSKRVENGVEAIPFTHPWMGRLHYLNQIENVTGGICSVFLVNRSPNQMSKIEHGSSDIVLTAAHCVLNSNFKNYYVSFGRHNLSNDFEPHRVDVFVDHILIHRQYCREKSAIECSENDIAMLKLQTAVVFNEFIRPIALSNSSLLDNCSLSGWGNLKDSDGVLATINLQNVIDQGFNLEVITSGTTTITKGDSGSPLICLLNEGFVVRGIISKGDGLHEQFCDTVKNLQWIIDAFNEIDSAEKPYHPELVAYARPFNRRSVDAKQSFDLFLNYTENLRSIQEEDGANYVYQWFTKHVYSGLVIKPEQFCPQNVTGFAAVENVYHCATICHSQKTYDKKPACSYLHKMKRCYLSFMADDQMCSTVPAEHSVTISWRPRDYYFKIDQAIANSQRPTNATRGQVKPRHIWIMWNVSVRIEKKPDFHCLGYLTSIDEKFYSNITIASGCLRRLKMTLSNATMVNVLARFKRKIVRVIILGEFTKDENTATMSAEISPVKVPKDYPSIFGHDIKEMRDFKRINFIPRSGSFISKPFAAPFLVNFKNEYNETCMGILIDSRQLLNESVGQDRLQFALTSATCARTMMNQSVLANIGSQNLNGMALNQMIVASVHIYESNFTTTGQKWRPDPLHNIAIVKMCHQIPGPMLRPINLPTYPVPLNSTFIVFTWNVSGGDTRLPLYEAPVVFNKAAVESQRIQKSFLTKRLHMYGDAKLNNELEGRPLVAYDEQSGTYTLAGIYSKGLSSKKAKIPGTLSKRVEFHTAVYPHIHWITKTLERILNDEEGCQNSDVL